MLKLALATGQSRLSIVGMKCSRIATSVGSNPEYSSMKYATVFLFFTELGKLLSKQC